MGPCWDEDCFARACCMGSAIVVILRVEVPGVDVAAAGLRVRPVGIVDVVDRHSASWR